jgi:transposase
MEACGSAHFWARRIQALGHEAVLLPPHAVRPYVRRNKTDRTDTKGMLEAYRNEEIRHVPVKTIAQQTLARSIVFVPAGSPSAPLASTPCAGCSVSSGS